VTEGDYPFPDRAAAGRALARRLVERFGGRDDVLVLALPRGGVPVGFEVARALGAPLDVFLVRKLGVPGQPELAMGAIALGGTRVLNPEVVAALRISSHDVEAVTREEAREIERRARAYRDDRPVPDVAGKTVVLVDDGLATGSTMQAAAVALREAGPAAIVAAVPVGSQTACAALSDVADEVVCAEVPEPFYAVGQGYRDFTQTTDEEVRDLLLQASGARPPR
jgi:predicted phosphoribosyltransferase